MERYNEKNHLFTSRTNLTVQGAKMNSYLIAWQNDSNDPVKTHFMAIQAIKWRSCCRRYDAKTLCFGIGLQGS